MSVFRESLSGTINPVVLKDVLDSMDADAEFRLLVYECMRDIVEIESKHRQFNKPTKPK